MIKTKTKKMIIIMKGSSESQTPIVTIDTKTCHYPYAIRNAIELALEFAKEESYGKLNSDLWKGFVFGFKKAVKLIKQR